MPSFIYKKLQRPLPVVVCLLGVFLLHSFASAQSLSQVEQSAEAIQTAISPHSSSTRSNDQIPLPAQSDFNRHFSTQSAFEKLTLDSLANNSATSAGNAVVCSNPEAEDISTFVQIDNSSDSQHLTLRMVDKYKGMSWPMQTDMLRVGTLVNIDFDLKYQSPTKQRCLDLKQVLSTDNSELSEAEERDWLLCTHTCNQVLELIKSKTRLTKSDKIALAVCRQDVSRSMVLRQQHFEKIGEFVDLTFSKQNCDISANGFLNCYKKGNLFFGNLPVVQVKMLGLPEVTLSNFSIKRSYTFQFELLVRLSEYRLHRYILQHEYSNGEVLHFPEQPIQHIEPHCHTANTDEIGLFRSVFDEVVRRKQQP